MRSVEEILNRLREKGRPDQLSGMSGYGMSIKSRLGVAIPELRKTAKELGRDHNLALSLFETGISEAMILASMVDEPEQVTEKQMDEWVRELDSWDVCDQVCMNLFEKTRPAWKKAREWSKREDEYVKRAAYSLIACLAWHNKKALDDDFIKLLPVIKEGAKDERNMVKKAVSWALRTIGKRNPRLNGVVLQTAEELVRTDLKSSKWIGSDVKRDLASEAAKRRMEKARGA